jgi:hypothetical protein
MLVLMRRFGALCRIGAIGALLVATVGRAAAPGSQLEVAVKASYLTKFGPFVQWPPAAMPAGAAPLHLCVVGVDPFGEMLEAAVHGQLVQGHPVAVVRMRAVDRATAASCHIMFVGKPAGQPTAVTLRTVADLPVLTVTDRSRGVNGGIIEFVIDNDRVRFDVDDVDARQSGLQISSKLLALAVSVRR